MARIDIVKAFLCEIVHWKILVSSISNTLLYYTLSQVKPSDLLSQVNES